MKKFLITLLLVLLGLSTTAQVTEKSFDNWKGSYVLGNDTLKVGNEIVTLDNVTYNVNVDYGTKRNYDLFLSKEDGTEWSLSFNKKVYGTYITLMQINSEESAYTMVCLSKREMEQAKIE